MQPPPFFVDAETGFVIVHHQTRLQGRLDPLQNWGDGIGTLLTGGKHAGLGKRRCKQVAQDLADSRQREQMQTGQIHGQRFDVGAILRRGEGESIWQISSRLGLTAGASLHFDLIFGNLEANAWQIKHLHSFCSGKRSRRKILLTVLALGRCEQNRLVRLLHHHQGFPYMAGLPSTLFAALFSQALRYYCGCLWLPVLPTP